MYTFRDFDKQEHRELLEPLIELLEEHEDGIIDYCSTSENGYQHKTETFKDTFYGYKLGVVYGRKMFHDDDLDSLYFDAFKALKLDNIIKTYGQEDDHWELTDIWEAQGITITSEAITYLYFTFSETTRLNILERAIEASQMVGIPVVDKLCIRLCREALQFEKEGNRCLA